MKTQSLVALVLFALMVLSVGGCGGPRVSDDPVGDLRNPDLAPYAHDAAMAVLDATPSDPAYLEALHRCIWRPGYTVDVRESAFRRLEETDPEGLQRTIRQQLPRLSAWEWLTRLSELIADRGWIEQSRALVSSWARPTVHVQSDLDRPEYKALVRLHGEGNVTDAVFTLFLESQRVSDQNLRTRCWELLHRLGQRDRLIEIVARAEADESDLMMHDLRTAARDLGLIPYNREEILWLRQLRQPEHSVFWEQAKIAIEHVSPERRAQLEIRDLPILVSAALHEPELLTASRASLYQRLNTAQRGAKTYGRSNIYDGSDFQDKDSLFDHRDVLTWGDLTAMLLLRRALDVPQVRSHLFDFAERDRADKSTEYGGLINLDSKGRFEVLEFVPRIRQHDQKFIASQAMFDAAYTSLFHFHYHAQVFRNAEYSGPGFGDLNYADNTRANCVVLTYVNPGVLNVDYYRHGRVMVDLGTIVAEGVASR